MTRTRLNLDTGELDNLARLAEAQRQIKEIADELWLRKTSKRDERKNQAGRLNMIASSIKTVELRLGGEES